VAGASPTRGRREDEVDPAVRPEQLGGPGVVVGPGV